LISLIVNEFQTTGNQQPWSHALQLVVYWTATNASKGTFDKLFVFGDSFVDTGNRDPNNNTYTAIGRVNQNWAPPYGRTNPGEPAGRFSDGKVLSDLLGTTH